MADFETKLRGLSERGNPVGAEELIDRIEADLAEDPIVVVGRRREGTIVTKTRRSPKTSTPSRYRGPAWAGKAFVAVLAVATVYLAFSGDGDQVADTPPPTTTVAPEVEIMTDLEVIEAGVAALYSGDADRAVEFFELPDRDDDQIRTEAAYQAAIGGGLNLNCTEGFAPDVFTCNMPYHNAVTEAIGYVDSPGDTARVAVQDGVITEFHVPEHEFLRSEVGGFLADQQIDGYEDCVEVGGRLVRTAECANVVMAHLDEWTAWCGRITEQDLFASSCDTTENGQPVAELRRSNTFLDIGDFNADGWSYSFAGWDFTPTMDTLVLANLDERVVLVADPLPVETGCEVGPAPADVEALAQSIRTAPDLEVSEPVAVSVGGIEGVRMDVVAAPGASRCDYEGWPGVLAATDLNDESHRLVDMPVGSRMRLYLVDLPGGTARILSVAIVAPESRFESVVEQAAPILDSFEFDTR